MEPRVPAALPQQQQQTTYQSVRAPNVKGSSLNKMLNVVIMVIQQIMPESNSAVLEETKYWILQKLS
jgi:hypothetical protein